MQLHILASAEQDLLNGYAFYIKRHFFRGAQVLRHIVAGSFGFFS